MLAQFRYNYASLAQSTTEKVFRKIQTDLQTIYNALLFVVLSALFNHTVLFLKSRLRRWKRCGLCTVGILCNEVAGRPEDQIRGVRRQAGQNKDRMQTLTPGECCCPLYTEAKCEWWAVTVSDGPENVLSVHEDTAGSHANLTAGEINRLLTTQLPAAATTAACQPRQMHDSHISSTDTVFFSM